MIRSAEPLLVEYCEAARMLALSVTSIRRLVAERKLAKIGEGRGARIVVASIHAYIAKEQAHAADNK